MKTMSAAEFKTNCLRVLDEVAESRSGVVVTKRGKPVARLVPMVDRPARIVGALKAEIEIRGDIISPLGIRWEALGR